MSLRNKIWAVAGWLLATAMMAGAEPVTVQVVKKADFVAVKVVSEKATTPVLKMVDSKRFFEWRFPNSEAQPAKKSIAVDKGLIQKVTWAPSGQDTVIRVHVLSRPKSSVKSSTKQHTLTLSTVQMAGTKPAAKADPEPKTPQPITTRPQPQPQPVSTAPQPVQPTRPPQPVSNSSAANKKVTVVMNGVSQREALEAIAAQAGLKPKLAGSLSGVTSASMMETPVLEAVKTVLGPAADDFEIEITSTELIILPQEGSAPVAVRTPAGKVEREYFPIKGQKKASEMVEAVKRAVPNVKYLADDRLNIVLAEGDAADIARVRKLLAPLSSK